MKLKLIMLVSLFLIGSAMSATAGTIDDTDGDLIPNVFDNCSLVVNGPASDCDQLDSDGDDLGDNCDGDYNASGTVNSTDFGVFFAAFLGGPATLGEDANCSGTVNSTDFGLFFAQFLVNAPGPGAD